MVSLVTSMFTGINSKTIKAEEPTKTKPTREFVHATKDELKETLVIDGVTWKRISLVEEKKQFFPEIRFSHHRELTTYYYLLWRSDNKDGSKGHLSKGHQTNYWWADDNGYGFQKGYQIWKEKSLRLEIANHGNNNGSGNDFLNNEFQTKDKNGLEYVFQTGGSFTDNVSFYASKEVIEAFLKTTYGESSTFKLNDFKRTAKLENRIVRPTDEGSADPKVADYVESHQTSLHSVNDCRDSSVKDKLEEAPKGIDYTDFEDYYNELNLEQFTNVNTDTSKVKDMLVVVEKAKKQGDTDKLGILSARYGNEDFNYYADSFSTVIGYSAKYETDGEIVDPEKPDPDPDPEKPDSGKGGDIIFIPNSTKWTNKGKTGEGTGAYPIQVKFNGKNPQVLKGQAEYEYETCSGKGENEKCKTHHGWKPISFTYTINNITVTGDATGSFSTGSGGTVYLKKEGAKQHLNATGTWNEKRGSMPSHATKEVKEPTPPPNPKGSSGYYNIDWTKTDIKVNPECQGKWVNAKAKSGYPVDVGVTDNLSGFDKGTVKFSDSSHYNRKYDDTLPQNGLKYNKTFKLDDGMYAINISANDVAGNKNGYTNNTYYVDRTEPEANFSVKAGVFPTNHSGGVRKNSKLGNGDGFFGTLTVWDNLSGVNRVDYGWTFGNNEKSCSYSKIVKRNVILK